MVARELREKLKGVPDDYEVIFHLDATFDVEEVDEDGNVIDVDKDVTLNTDVEFESVDSMLPLDGKAVINFKY